MLTEFIGLEVFAFTLVFCRIGAAFLAMPVIGEAYISPRIRLMFAVAFAFIVTPLVDDLIPPAPQAGTLALLLLIAVEILIGVFIGAVMRIMVSALATAGGIISLVSGFANAILFNPALSDQGSLQSVFLSLLGLALILATDLHHIMLMGLVDTYKVFPPGDVPMMGDFSNTITVAVSESFALAMKLAAPFIVIIVVFFMLLGLIARMMPQLQIFFLAMPVQIYLGLAIFMVALPSMMLLFLEVYAAGLSRFFSFE